jgi:hypothetical protein
MPGFTYPGPIFLIWQVPVNESSDNGPVDVPTLAYYTVAKSGAGYWWVYAHPLDALEPPQ